MPHFNKDFLKFFKELEKNNEREWFHANKKRYEENVKKPFSDFVALMLDKMQVIDGRIVLLPKDAIFRINRDIRFSKDKSPYKNHVSAILSPGGRKNMHAPGIYLQLNHKSAEVYSGQYRLDAKQLQKVRTHIAANLKTFEKLIRQKKFVEKFGEIQGEKNKRLPKEFQELAEKQPLIANKAFYFMAQFKPTVILEKDFPKLLMDHYKAARPLSTFFEEALKD